MPESRTATVTRRSPATARGARQRSPQRRQETASTREIPGLLAIGVPGCLWASALQCHLDRSGSEAKSGSLLSIWNHRWEFDKNPELFFQTLFKLKKEGIEFELAVLGEQFKEYPPIFNEARLRLSDNIIQFGYCESFQEYAKWLWRADVLPVTSNQDFFGISIVEAVYCNTYPILPKRLSYPELFELENNSHYFYKNDTEFYQTLKKYLLSLKKDTFNSLPFCRA